MDAKQRLADEEKTPHPNALSGVTTGGDQTAYIALGSNLGDRAANITAAVNALRNTPHVKVIRESTLLENPAIGGSGDSPPFLNAMSEVHTTLPPINLLHRLLEIEKELGRVRRAKWEPRIIDLDLILYGDQIIQTAELIVPHPLMHQRRFVLQPLAQLCPDLIHPIQKLSIADLLERMSPAPIDVRNMSRQT